MSKIGFKCSWIQDEPETQHESREQIAITPAMEHMVDLQYKIQNLEHYMTTTRFARLNKQDKQETIQTYSFLLKSVMMIQPSSGMMEFGSIDIEE